MRSAVWILGGLMIMAVIALQMWSSTHSMYSPVPPGQYPLDENRPEWSSTPAVGRYRPRKSAGQDTLAATGFMDAKRSCGDGRVRGREICTLPTVPVGEIYEPTLLQD